MLGLFFITDFLNSHPPHDWSLEAEPLEYTPKFRFSKQMYFRADSYTNYSLFDVEPCSNLRDHSNSIYSPNGNFLYREVVLPARGKLGCSSGKRQGEVCFDDDVLISQVHEVGPNGKTKLWMSHTPNEVMTLRPGTRVARGHVVIGGLGLGYQLLEVAKKKNVKKITLIEHSQEMVDWILPEVTKKLSRDVCLEVIVGSVFDELPKLTADVALVDVWESMSGCQGFHPDSAYHLRKSTPNIPKIWCWGETS